MVRDASAHDGPSMLNPQALTPSTHMVPFTEEVKAAFPEHDGVFIPKKGSPAVHCGAPPDGVALFVRRAMWTIALQECDAYPDGPGSARKGNQCYIVAGLTPTDARWRPLVVGVTHLKAKRGFDELRTHQITSLLAVVDKVADRGTREGIFTTAPGVVVLGDFNRSAWGRVRDEHRGGGEVKGGIRHWFRVNSCWLSRALMRCAVLC